MSQQATETAAIRKSLTVGRPVDEAFRVFTERIGTWWPLKAFSIGQDRAETAVMESGEGGRLYERSVDGEESDWGHVLTWEPPHRVRFTFHPGEPPELATEVEIRFESAGDGTRVELEHVGWERLGDRGPKMRSSYDAGWSSVLGVYKERVEA